MCASLLFQGGGVLLRIAGHGIIWFCACIIGMAAQAAPEPMRYIYPAPESVNDVRHGDVLALMRAALERTLPEYGSYVMKPASGTRTKARQLADLRHGAQIPDDLTVVWNSTSNEMERDFLAIKIPLRKNLTSYHIAFIRADRQAQIDKVKTLEDLRHLTIGVGLGWSGVSVFRANNIPVIVARYEDLFNMLAAGRYDLFPRGVNEIFDEYTQQHAANPNLAIEKHLLLYYPSLYYFFFNRNNTRAAERLEKGLLMIIKDGEFDKIFKRYHGKSIEAAQITHRRIIKLINPDVTLLDTPFDKSAHGYAQKK